YLGKETTLFRTHQNNFIDSGAPDQQAMDEGTRNSWDDGSMGNYWSDMLTRYPRALPLDDTVYDTPYYVGTPVA
ncbi:MAG: hypothetical protein GWN18_17755, partial [Thermoplasmata archaeon]|nr:hypothetical protein [Thermoplasmata archaeon]NIS13969.1 hypothetical protein [Thermoplasmata archaeon]NIS21806.1 hypothetical protein [Thermoplasmata archaeon]NIT79410.1 hypothetical protein [Thermoplasmata archaeon]NIU50839.1 hypothetical protein [Thermoplasmata archaeon]